MNKAIKVLDCTLRDGGYYCNWEYSLDLVEEYLESMSHSGVDVVEIGLRVNTDDRFLGAFSYCTEDFLRSISIPPKLLIAVMLNVKEFVIQGDLDIQGISRLFVPINESRIQIVRIASHLDEIENALKLADILKAMGYTICLNLMQIGEKSPLDLEKYIETVSNNQNVDVLYLADSFGNMSPSNINDLVTFIKRIWKKELGIHAHNNMGMAILNTKAALECGVSWLDSTVLGMGRGAGNTETEHLLLELRQIGFRDYKAEVLFPLVLGKFAELKRKYQWGGGLLYYLSAKYSIHPTYIQELLSQSGLELERLLDAIESLKNQSSSSYNKKQLFDAVTYKIIPTEGSWEPSGELHNSTVIIVAGGESVSKYKDGLSALIKKLKPKVISLNLNSYLDKSSIDYFIASHPTKVQIDIRKYKSLNKPLIIPFNALNNELRKELSSVKVKNFGLGVGDNFQINSMSCIVNSSYVLAYALAVCASGKVNKIYFAGLDGYENRSDERFLNTQRILNIFSKDVGLELSSITPTMYSIKCQSLYSPFL